MLGLMLAAVCDTVIAPPPEMDVVRVHEWGVVWFGETRVAATADPASAWEMSGEDPDPMYLAEAPVVYIHGPDFTGSLEVTAETGSFLVNHPEASGMTETSLTWRFDAYSEPEGEEAFPPPDLSAEWPVELWRDVPASLLRFDGGAVERFIYYETGIPVTAFPSAREIIAQDRPDGALLVMRDSSGLHYAETDPAGIPTRIIDMRFAPLEDDVALEHLCGWADGQLKTEEVRALWKSWDDYLLEGDWEGDVMLLFPLARARIDRISRLTLQTDQGYRREYHRLFVGMTPLDRL
jgi:hypothetical protein